MHQIRLFKCLFVSEFYITYLSHLVNIPYSFYLQFRNDDSSNGVWIAAETKEEALKQGSEKLGTAPDNLEGHQDPDVLDTWFSSGLYPFAVFGWPNENPGIEIYLN